MPSGRVKGSLTPAERAALSERMRQYNRTRKDSPETMRKRSESLKRAWVEGRMEEAKRKNANRVRTMVYTQEERQRRSERMWRLHQEGRIPRGSPLRRVAPPATVVKTKGKRRRKTLPSLKERQAASLRMRLHNPMFRPEVRARVSASLKRNAAERRSRWRAMYGEEWTTVRYGPNKAEASLLTLISPLGFLFVGDGRFWIGPCQSGKRRNPDFILGSGRNKAALLYNGAYWHSRPDTNATEQLADYQQAGWRVFVVDEAKMRQPLNLVREVRVWLNGNESIVSQIRMSDPSST